MGAVQIAAERGVQMPASPLASCATASELPNLSSPQFSRLWNGNGDHTYLVHQAIARLKWHRVTEVSGAVAGPSVLTCAYTCTISILALPVASALVCSLGPIAVSSGVESCRLPADQLPLAATSDLITVS